MALLVNARDNYLQNSTRSGLISLSVVGTVTGYGVDIVAINTSNITATNYIFKLGNGTDNSFATSTLLVTTGSSQHTWTAQTAGVYVIWCVASDINGNLGTPTSTTVVIAAPGTSSIGGVITGPNLKLDWTISVSSTSFAIDYYEIRYGNNWENGTVIGTTKATTYTTRVTYLGAQIWWVAARSIGGTYSTPTGVTVTVNAPSTVSTITIDVVDNNALIYWTPPTVSTGQLPIDYYEVRKGVTYATSVVVGSNGNSTFSSIFEQIGGIYNYWVTAFDTAGNQGVSLSRTTNISQPPDYILRNSYNSVFTAGTKVNFVLENGILVGPVDVTQTWQTHFVNNSWTTPQAQVNAGYPIYALPGLTTGSYEEIIDYGTTIPSTIVTATLSASTVTGTVNNTCVLSYKLLSTDAWTVFTAGTTQLITTSFRYIRVQYSFTATGNNNLIRISGLNIKLAIKQRTDSGNATYDSTKTAAENFVSFGYAFLSADTPIIQPSGTAVALTPVVSYSGGINPTGFSVILYNRSGVAVSGAYSWSARGY